MHARCKTAGGACNSPACRCLGKALPGRSSYQRSKSTKDLMRQVPNRCVCCCAAALQKDGSGPCITVASLPTKNSPATFRQRPTFTFCAHSSSVCEHLG